MQSPALLRLVVFVILAVHMWGSPVLDQLFDVGKLPFGMTWQMYASPGNNVCAAQWFTASEDGELAPLDRFEVLEVTEPWKAPGNVQRQYSPRDLQSAANKLCGKLKGADVRANARCAVQRGMRWKQVLTADTPLCGRDLPPAPRKSNKPSKP